MHKILIDTDPGIDDAMAIFYAGLRADVEILGLTSVFGNVYTSQATRNALVLLDKLGHDCPVAEGAHLPLENPGWDDPGHFVHGPEGFGDLPAMAPSRPADPRSAMEFIVETINAHRGEVTLCPLGPLTNIALALQLDPTIADKVKEVVIMGGGIARGNITDWAEANIWGDPLAADQVFAADWPVRMIGLDVTTKVLCTLPEFEALRAPAPMLGGMLADMLPFYIRFYKSYHGLDASQMHDPTALIAVTHPELFTVETLPLEVILDGERIGQTVRSKDENRPDVKVATGVQAEAVKDLFLQTIASGY